MCAPPGRSIVCGSEDAEFVALRIGQHHPALVATLPDVDMPRTQRQHPVHLGLLIIRTEVEVDAVLHHLLVGHREEDPGHARTLWWVQPDVTVLVDIVRPVQHLRPPASQRRGIASVDTDFVEPQAHCANSFFNTFPMALRGRLSTTRTSRGRLCTESSWAT